MSNFDASLAIGAPVMESEPITLVALLVLLDGPLPEMLGTVGLARLQGVTALVEKSLRSAQAWQRALALELPAFAFDASLLVLPERHRLLAAVPQLLETKLSEGLAMSIRSASEAQRFVKALRAMHRTASAHVASGGRMAHMLVGRFAFPGDAAVAALTAFPSAIPDDSQLEDLPCVMSEINTFEFGAECGIASGPLEIRLALRGGSLLLGTQGVQVAQDDNGDNATEGELLPSRFALMGGAGQEHDGFLTVDLVTASGEILLSKRGMTANADGSLSHSNGGMCSILARKPVASKALEEGLLCVLCVRDFIPEQPEECRLACALQLDRIRSE
mmetsp:Transcript_72187/g.154524  ORF Transcript_72187/g.154524 Transcript_72187/m.154524 type:complete len:332 (-) Transcript_72187:162-1157(-)